MASPDQLNKVKAPLYATYASMIYESNPDKAYDLINRALNIHEKDSTLTIQNYLFFKAMQAMLAELNGDTSAAIRYYEQTMELSSSLDNQEMYYSALQRLGHCCSENSLYEKGILYLDEYLAYLVCADSVYSYDFLYSTYDKIYLLYLNGLYVESISLADEIISVNDSLSCFEEPILANVYDIKAQILRLYEMNISALKCYKDAADIFSDRQDIFPCLYLKMSEQYAVIGDYSRARQCYDFAIQNFDSINSTALQLYAFANDQAYALYAMHRYAEAFIASQKVQNTGRTKIENFCLQSLLADVYHSMGNYKDELRIRTDNIRTAKSLDKKSSYFYANEMIKYLQSYAQVGEENGKNNADSLYDNIIVTLNEVPGGIDMMSYSAVLIELARWYSREGDYDEALRLLNNVYDFYTEETSCRYIHNFYVCLGELGYLYVLKGGNDFSRGLNLLQRAQNGIEQDWGPYYPAISSILIYLSQAYLINGDVQKSEEIERKWLEVEKHNLFESLKEIPLDDQKNYIDLHVKNLRYNANFVNSKMSDERCKLAYDGLLLSKGILSAWNIALSNMIHSADDKLLQNKLSEQIQLRRDQDALLRDSDIALANLVKLKVVTSEIEVSNYIDSKYESAYRQIFVGWSDIANNLRDCDVAIEFSTVEDKGSYDVNALILRHNWHSPKHVFVGRFAKGLQIDNSSFRTFWNKIVMLGLLSEGENVYVSMDGELHNTPVEYIRMPDGQLFVDKYHVHRVSSTRILNGNIRNQYQPKSAVLYGGLLYDISVSEMIEQSHKYESQNRCQPLSSDNSDLRQANIADRSQFVYLPYTKSEVNAIGNILRDYSVDVHIYEGVSGGEESFHSMHGKSPDVLHIATHGYFITQTEADSLNYVRRNRMGILNKSLSTDIDYSMSRTGLLLSGAMARIKGDSIPEGVEDGILSAKEISYLDLSNTDLVVLSACNTGLGDITSDGVAGLQRGFKMAGVNSIMMSLWPVDDAATYLLMTEFYKNYLGGKTKTESLREAQRYLRNYEQDGEKIFADPKYWAAFVLLDAPD